MFTFVQGVDYYFRGKPIEKSEPKIRIQEEGFLKIIVPQLTLLSGSLVITSSDPSKNTSFEDWDQDEITNSHRLIKNIINVWEKRNISSYLLFGQVSFKKLKPFSWEMVPFSETRFPFWNCFKVIWNIIFGSKKSCLKEREKIKENFLNLDHVKQQNFSLSEKKNVDYFCNRDVIEKQRVYEGEKINVLLSYDPLGGAGLHFLLIPKEHRNGLNELDVEEYVECDQLSQRLISIYKEEGCINAFLFDKTGKLAGQSVPHHHRHLVFTKTPLNAILGKIKVLKNMIFGPGRLSDQELKKRVDFLKSDLAPKFKKKESFAT